MRAVWWWGAVVFGLVCGSTLKVLGYNEFAIDMGVVVGVSVVTVVERKWR